MVHISGLIKMLVFNHFSDRKFLRKVHSITSLQSRNGQKGGHLRNVQRCKCQ